MFGCYREEAETEINDSDPYSYYMAFFSAYIQFIKKTADTLLLSRAVQ